jgi:hypothetical protein
VVDLTGRVGGQLEVVTVYDQFQRIERDRILVIQPQGYHPFWPALPIGEVEGIRGDVHNIAVCVHHLTRGTGRLTKAFFPACKPCRLDFIAL